MIAKSLIYFFTENLNYNIITYKTLACNFRQNY